MKLSFLSIILVAAVGCTIPLEAGGGHGNGGGAWVPPSEYTAEDLANGRISGEMGSLRGFDDSLRNLLVDTGNGYSYVEAHVLGDYGWAMIGLNFNGDLGVDTLAPGAILTPRNEDRFYTYAVGCSGPDYQEADYDSPPEDYVITVAEDDAGELYLDVTADFGQAGMVTGVLPLPGVR